MCQVDWPLLASVLKELLTPMIAVIAAYIAYQQWQTNKNKLFFDQYERRLKVYEEVKQILTILNQEAKGTIDDLVKFRRAVSEADFLFKPEILKYVDEIYNRGILLQHWYKWANNSAVEDTSNSNEKLQVEEKWFLTQQKQLKQKFEEYLKIKS